MKIIIALIITFSFSPAYAELYKCQSNGKTGYQQKPCKTAGNEFLLKKDISLEQQQSAAKKLEDELAIKADKKQMIEPGGSNASLNRQNAKQVEALEKRNEIGKNIKRGYRPFFQRP